VDPLQVRHVVQRVGPSRKSIEEIVAAVARADIRTHMNTLRTWEFFNPGKRAEAIDRVRQAMATRLEPEGIIVERVIYMSHRFERRLPDGTMDQSYQEMIDRTQAIIQEQEQEEKKIATVKEQKEREKNEQQARVNRVVEQADGFKKQAVTRGDAYLEAKKNEAEQVRAVGMAEVEGLKKQVEALKGPGGRALLRLAVAKALLAKNPRFVVLNTGKGGASTLDLNRVDANEIMREAGVFVASPEMQKGKEIQKAKEGARETAPAAAP
jgi:hypothetical protein